MKFWLDTEFNEDGRTIDLISIGVVAEDGQEFYRQNASADLRAANPWVQQHVIPQLYLCPAGIPGPRHLHGMCARADECAWRPKFLLAAELRGWVYERRLQDVSDPIHIVKPEFWGYYADYDWVAICQLFGPMVGLPEGWPMYCRDLKQWCDQLGNPRLPEQGKDEHHALSDARWNRQAYEFLHLKQAEVYSDIGMQGVAIGEDHARRKEARPVDQEPSHVRSHTPGSPRVRKGRRGKDQQLGPGQGDQEGQAPLQVRQVEEVG